MEAPRSAKQGYFGTKMRDQTQRGAKAPQAPQWASQGARAEQTKNYCWERFNAQEWKCVRAR